MNRLCWLLLIPVIVTVSGLVTAADWLLWQTPGWPALPLGNAATWGASICIAALVLLRRPTGPLRVSALIGMVLSLAWGIVGYFMAGNWRYSFEAGNDGTLWWRLSIGLGVLLVINLCWTLMQAAVRKARKKR